jgi:hypothetical protein
VVKAWHLGAAMLIVGYFAYFLATHTSRESLEDQRDRALEIAHRMEPVLSEYGDVYRVVSVRPAPYPDRDFVWVATFVSATDGPQCTYIDVDAPASEVYPTWRADCEKVASQLR